jgi:2-iminobutanoate/2-iminopropanoate deaminase
MSLTKIETGKAPQAIGPYSQGISANGFVFVSGQLGVDPATGAFAGSDVSAQTERVLENLRAVLEAAGSSMKQVVRCEVFLASMNDFSAMNEVYAKYFSADPKPARVTVEVSRLPKDALVEISCIAIN